MLTRALGIEVDMTKLEERAKETEHTLDRIRREMELRMRKERRREEEEA